MNREFGEVPGYEFETPRGSDGDTGRGIPPGASDGLRALRPAAGERRGPSVPARLVSRVLRVMGSGNWVTNLAVPVVAAVMVGIAAVTVTGGGGAGVPAAGDHAAASALAAGFPPARLAGSDFAGSGVSAGTSRVVLAAVAASAATDVVAGSADDGPALWVSGDGGSAWSRALLTGPAGLTRAGSGQLTGVAHGPAGWLAVGAARTGSRGPIVAGSRDGRAWAVTGGLAVTRGGSATGDGGESGADAVAVAAGPAGYVIVGRQRAAGGTAAAWYARGLTGWRRAAVARPAAAATGPGAMNAVSATARGFTAVGSAGPGPAAWLSATGQSWRAVAVPRPAGAARAVLDYVAADGSDVVAAGFAVSAAGTRSPFTAVSGDAGATWSLEPLPEPAGGAAATTVTALTAAGHGFIAVGTDNAAGGADVVIWTVPATAVASASESADAGWTVVTPRGNGLAGPGTQAITALTAQGATLTGVGFTATSTAQRPTLWQSPIRY